MSQDLGNLKYQHKAKDSRHRCRNHKCFYKLLTGERKNARTWMQQNLSSRRSLTSQLLHLQLHPLALCLDVEELLVWKYVDINWLRAETCCTWQWSIVSTIHQSRGGKQSRDCEFNACVGFCVEPWRKNFFHICLHCYQQKLAVPAALVTPKQVWTQRCSVNIGGRFLWWKNEDKPPKPIHTKRN